MQDEQELQVAIARATQWVNDNNEAHGWYDPDPAQVDTGVTAVYQTYHHRESWREAPLRDVVTAVIRATGRTFGDEMALLVSEAGEALDAFRKHGMEDVTQTIVIHIEGDPPKAGPPFKPEGAASELADIFVRLLDTCSRYNVDLGKEFIRKMRYNETRPYRHGGKKL